MAIHMQESDDIPTSLPVSIDMNSINGTSCLVGQICPLDRGAKSFSSSEGAQSRDLCFVKSSMFYPPGFTIRSNINICLLLIIVIVILFGVY